MGTIMETDDQLERWLADDIPSEMLSTPLPDEVAKVVVERLKQEADRYWFIDPNYSLKFADRIITIGRTRNNKSEEALGLMARGDALKYIGNLQEAWEMLEESGNMYQSVGNEVGWARTRIGRLHISPRLNYVPIALSEAERARAIFSEYDEQEKLLRLENNLAYVYTLLGDQRQALHLYHSALSIAEAIGDAGQSHIGLIHMNIGFVHEALGDFPKALAEYEHARAIYISRNETRNIVNIELNIAYIAQAQGHYKHALRLLYNILERGIDQLPLEERAVKRDLTECYLYLNRYSEARDLARQVIDGYKSFHATYDTARALLHLATAEAELGNFIAALEALDEAKTIFISLGANSWTMITRLRYGQIALKQGNLSKAYEEAFASETYFQSEGQQVNYATACLLTGQTTLVSGDLASAGARAGDALQIAQRYSVPSLRYSAHLLLGQIAEAQSLDVRAIRCYQAAAATIERVQRSLTITLRSGFLENKGDAWRGLLRLFLDSGQTERAFEALEQSKSQVLLGYLANREALHWAYDDYQSQALITELAQLRAEHQSFYRLAYQLPRNPDHPSIVQSEQTLVEVAVRERRMRAITEQLYLQSKTGIAVNPVSIVSLQDIQETLDCHTLLIEFYSDNDHMWAFVLDGHTCDIQPLPMTVDKLNGLLIQLQTNLAAALEVDAASASARRLTQLGQRILQRLYSLLLEPLTLERYGRERLMIVPYGALHYLPFHLLYDGSTYLIERFEIVTLPAASLVVHPNPKRSPGALILSHSWNGRLPYTEIEAQTVQSFFGGTMLTNEFASRAALQVTPTQILHIAAHGQYRLDQPDLSYIELADGQLYADDLLQQDLTYELITLSGCETGRANVAADEELIGLGRRLLYAGAGALILSLWQVTDTTTLTLMERLYSALHAGSSKAAALREAQLFILQQDRRLHPALWGAFQLIGDASRLSTIHE
jgi:CHAT domain-containing protein